MEKLTFIKEVIKNIQDKNFIAIHFEILKEAIRLQEEDRYISGILTMRTFIETYLRNNLIQHLVKKNYSEEIKIFPQNKFTRFDEIEDLVENGKFEDKQITELMAYIIKLYATEETIKECVKIETEGEHSGEIYIKIPSGKLNKEEENKYKELMETKGNKSFSFNDICNRLKEEGIISNIEKRKRNNYYGNNRNAMMHGTSKRLHERFFGEEEEQSIAVCGEGFSANINIPLSSSMIRHAKMPIIYEKTMEETMEICYEVLKKFYIFTS